MCSIYRVQSRRSVSSLISGDTVPYLKCSGGDYVSHHNIDIFLIMIAFCKRKDKSW